MPNRILRPTGRTAAEVIDLRPHIEAKRWRDAIDALSPSAALCRMAQARKAAIDAYRDWMAQDRPCEDEWDWEVALLTDELRVILRDGLPD